MQPTFGYVGNAPRDTLAEEIASCIENEARYIPAIALPEVPDNYGFYEYAQQLAEAIDLSKGNRWFARLKGSFIFGDFIEALFERYDIHTTRLVISTYSLSQNNVDSLRNLMEAGRVSQLDLIVSDYFYTHERGREGLIPYIYEELDIDNRFQLAVCGTHDKLCHFITEGGKHVNIYGSANLRSSGSIEHMTVEVNKELYDFFVDSLVRILKSYSTIKKSIRHSKLWQQVVQEPQG